MPYDHLYVKPKNYYRLVNITKRKQIHRYELVVSKWEREVGGGQYKGR